MRNFTITKIWGIPIRINISLIVFLPILVWLIGSGEQITIYSLIISELVGKQLSSNLLTSGLYPWIIGFFAAIGLFISVTLHELGHSWVALRYDINIESITLWIFGGIASLESIPKEWNREFWIAIAGPITSIGIGLIFYVVATFIPISFSVLLFVLGWLAIINIILAIFNMIPAFPMDGGRILRSLLTRYTSYVSATQIAARMGIIFAFIFGILGILSFNIILIFIAIFIYGAANSESRAIRIGDLLEGLTVKDIVSQKPIKIHKDAKISELINKIIQEKRTVYLVTDKTDNILGIVDLDDIRKIDKQYYETTPIEKIVSEPNLRIDMTQDAFKALVLLSKSNSKYILVEDKGKINAILTQSDFTNALDLQENLRVAQ